MLFSMRFLAVERRLKTSLGGSWPDVSAFEPLLDPNSTCPTGNFIHGFITTDFHLYCKSHLGIESFEVCNISGG